MKRFGGDGKGSAEVPGPVDASRSIAIRPGRRRRILALSSSFGSDALRAAGFCGAQARDFEDFVAGDRGGRSAGRIPLPDPGFREGLRRRLWQIQLLARRDHTHTTH
ncbi:MAG: hypothetical protein R3F21_13550 [Myxococcota bacterium]